MNRKEGRETMRKLHAIFNRCGVFFWLVWGTCLGVVRNGDLIKDDSDIDIGIFPQKQGRWYALGDEIYEVLGDYEEFWKRSYPSMLKIGDAYYTPENDMNPRVDVYVFHYSDTGHWWLTDYGYRGSDKPMDHWEPRTKLGGVRIPHPHFDHFTTVEYLGLKFYVPERTTDYLRYTYDELWAVPGANYRDDIWEEFDG